VVRDGGEVRESATPVFVQQIHVRSLGNSDDLPIVVFVRPSHGTVGTSEGTEIEGNSDPKFGMFARIPRLVGSTRHPSNIVDAGCHGGRATAWRTEIEYVIPGRLVFFLLFLLGLGKPNWDSHCGQ
jgi:hypothetical protein